MLPLRQSLEPSRSCLTRHSDAPCLWSVSTADQLIDARRRPCSRISDTIHSEARTQALNSQPHCSVFHPHVQCHWLGLANENFDWFQHSPCYRRLNDPRIHPTPVHLPNSPRRLGWWNLSLLGKLDQQRGTTLPRLLHTRPNLHLPSRSFHQDPR